jgi:hypothetical protein
VPGDSHVARHARCSTAEPRRSRRTKSRLGRRDVEGRRCRVVIILPLA